MEKTVKGATKIKLAAPKSKYVEPILSSTHGGEAGVAEVFRTLQLRLRDSTWTIVYKALIIVHLMIREGHPDVTLRYIAESPKRLAISNFTDVQTQGTNIRSYSDYLLERARAYRATKTDYVRVGAGKLGKLTVDKGLLRETEVVQDQIGTLLQCDLLGNEDPYNEITLTSFRLVTMDLLELFKVMNEGTINVLEHYFEMSRPDAERALQIYKTFGRQTNLVVQYLTVARKFEMATRLEVPKLKHAPTTLTSSLEEYLNDPDFEINRKQYLAQKGGKGSGKATSTSASRPTLFDKETKPDSSFPPSKSTTAAPPSSQQPKGPAPDLIDFFESIEQNQQPMAQPNETPQQFSGGFPQAQQYAQPNFTPQQTNYNPFLPQGTALPNQAQGWQLPGQQPLQADFTGAGFGGYGPQPAQLQLQQPYNFQSQLASIPQNDALDFRPQQQVQSPVQQIQPQPTSSNPFRQSTMPTGMSTASMPISPAQRQSTNPFAKHSSTQPAPTQHSAFGSFTTPPSTSQPFASSPPQTQHSEFQANSSFFQSPQTTSSPAESQPQFSPIQPQRTGTNPFARNRPPTTGDQPSQFPGAVFPPLLQNQTGNTNPFRQSAFVNQQTGQGWQHSAQGTLQGLDINSVPTVSVFPRPGA